MFSLAAITLALSAVALAEDHHVTVGADGLTFDPYALSAAQGDRVIFEFRAKNHTVTQTSFGNVCHPADGGFDSGYQPVAAEQTSDFPQVIYEVTTDPSVPLWFYCAQKTHCGKGMVFSINCPFDASAPNSFENFQASALAFGEQEAADAAASSSWAATATGDVYGTQTYDPVYHPIVTETVTLGDEVWTTTYESYANSPDPTPDAAEGVEHRVIVGGDGALTYDPPAIAAAVRDTIVFEFRSKNHTVTQSSFGNPCRKLEFTSPTGQVGFDSGFTPVADGTTEFPTFTITVNDTAPMWAYCRQAQHCGNGMVFSVNADESSDRNHQAFEALARTINGTGAASPPASSTGETIDQGDAAFVNANAMTAIASFAAVGVASLVTLLL